MIGGADEGCAIDMAETAVESGDAICLETVGMDIFYYRIMVLGRLEILADCQHFAADGTKIVERLEDFVLRFSEAKHYA